MSNLDKERAAIVAEENRLVERKKKLAEREHEERSKMIVKSVLAKLDQQRLEVVLGRMKSLGIDEVEKRLMA